MVANTTLSSNVKFYCDRPVNYLSTVGRSFYICLFWHFIENGVISLRTTFKVGVVMGVNYYIKYNYLILM